MDCIGIIGLGRMGSAMAQRMTSEGKTVSGWTRSGRTVAGVKTVPDLGALVNDSDILILSLLDDVAVENVLEALLKLDLKGKLIIDTSTVTPGVLIDRIKQLTTIGATAVDAPISGGPDLVMTGNCGVFIGGDDAPAKRASDTLETISQRIFHVGPLGTGLVMKVINNGMIQTYFGGLEEIIPLAKRAGLSLEMAMQILCGGPAGMPMVAARVPKILGQDDSVGFANSAVFKDNEVFQRVLGSYGLQSPSLRRFGLKKEAVKNSGLLEQDPAALVRHAYYSDAGS